jgi:hypothetical protein
LSHQTALLKPRLGWRIKPHQLQQYILVFTLHLTKMSSSNHSEGHSLIDSLKDILKDLHANPYPDVANPVGCKKRASVALVLRIRPSYEHEPPASEESVPSDSTTGRLDYFFSQGWVQHGDPECVFIKRAARIGDRWTVSLFFIVFCCFLLGISEPNMR